LALVFAGRGSGFSVRADSTGHGFTGVVIIGGDPQRWEAGSPN
jgi:hypothetical protein